MSDFTGVLSKLNADYQQAKDQKTNTSYWNLSTTFQELEGTLREHIQSITQGEIAGIISKLKSGQELTSHELEYIRLWIIGDADYYVKLENNYQDWIDELKRIVEEVNKINHQNPDFVTASKLRALLLDGIRVLGDIVFFRKEQDRVTNFEQASQSLGPDERALLVRVLEGKIASANE